MCGIGQRLAEERKRLGYNQTEFGTLGGVALRTIADWEKNKTSPNDGILMIRESKSPTLVREMLLAYLPESHRHEAAEPVPA